MATKTCSEDAGDNEKLKVVEDVVIDDGTFKYVLIKVKDPSSKQFKHIVRGFTWAGFHADIYEDEGVEPNLHRQGFKCSCQGGGRIKHLPGNKSILVYGYSQGYGRADHAMTVELLKKKYPEYGDNITFSNDGY